MWIIICCLYLKNLKYIIFKTMNPLPIDVFCSKYTDSEAPISVITKILSENDPIKIENISNEFSKSGFTKVKHLALATIGKASTVKLCGDSLTLLYGAIEIYTERLDNLLKSAKSEQQKGNFIKTQIICKELLTHKPTALNVIYLNAESFFKCGNYKECIDSLKILKNFIPKCYKVLSNLALAHLKNSENNLAKQYFLEACEIKPFCVDVWIKYAYFLYETNNLNSAEQVCGWVLSLNPELYNVRNMYGQLLFQLNKVKYAKKQFKIAHNSATKCPDILKNLGNVYYNIGKFEKAVTIYKKVLEMNPDQKDICLHLGMAYLKFKEFQNAANEFLKVLELEPENVSALRNLAVAYYNLDNMVLSVEVYKKCLKLQPENFDLNFKLAMISLHNLKNYQETIIYFKKCIQLNPERPKDQIELYENLFIAYRESNNYRNASDTCMTLCDLYLKSNDQDNARHALNRSILLNPGNAIGISFFQ